MFPMTPTDANFGKLIKQLESIVAWFDQQHELDIEEGLTKAAEAAELIKHCAKRLNQMENEFVKIKNELDQATAPKDVA